MKAEKGLIMAGAEKCGHIDKTKETFGLLINKIHEKRSSREDFEIANLEEDGKKIVAELGELIKKLIVSDSEGNINRACVRRISFHLQRMSADLLEISMNEGETPQELSKGVAEKISAILLEILSDC